MAIKLPNFIKYKYVMMLPAVQILCLRRLEPYTIAATSIRPPPLTESKSTQKIGWDNVLFILVLGVLAR